VGRKGGKGGEGEGGTTNNRLDFIGVLEPPIGEININLVLPLFCTG